MNEKKNWFEKNPKKTIFLTSTVLIITMLLIAEKILALKAIPDPYATNRYIRLKEHKPSFYGFITPTEYNLENADNLVKKKFLFRTDEDGFIMPSKIYDAPDATIVFIGGSTVEAMYVEEQNRFPYLVGRYIEGKTGLKINSYNAGVAGNNTMHSIDIFLNKVIPLNPDIAVIMNYGNDLSTLILEGTYWNKNPTRSLIITMAEGDSVIEILRQIKSLLIPNLYNAFYVMAHFRSPRSEFSHIREKEINIDKERLSNELRMNLQTFIDICKVRNITPVLITEPNRIKTNPDAIVIKAVRTLEEGRGVSYEAYKEIYDEFNETIRNVGKENNVLVIDLERKIPKEKTYMYDISHLTDMGSKTAAHIISEKLTPLIQLYNEKE